jgi:hypothetical protein
VDGDAAPLAGVDRLRRQVALAVFGVVVGGPGALLDFGFGLLDLIARISRATPCISSARSLQGARR